MICPVVDLAQQLISIPSISPKDLGCQQIIANRLLKLGFSIELMNKNDTSNLYAYKGVGKTLAFSGHTDVVPAGDSSLWKFPPFSPTIHNGILFGRGVVDMKGALAAMVIAIESFINKHPKYSGRLAFLVTSDEESKAVDGTVEIVKKLILRKETIDYCIIGEPSSVSILGDVIKNGRRGSLMAKISIFGISGHVAYPHLIDNPIHKIIPFLASLISHKWDIGNKFFSPTTVQIYDIKSQSHSNNMTPDQLVLKLNFRFNNEITINDIKGKINELLKLYHLKYSINWIVSGKPFINKSGFLINTVIKVIQHICKITPQLLTTGGTSDGRFISKMNTQILELGLINKTIHQVNESISVKDLKLLSIIYEYIITKVFI